MGVGGGVGATGKPIRVRLLSFLGSFVGDKLEPNRIFIGQGGNQISKGNFGAFQPKTGEGVNAFGQPGTWTSFGGYYEIDPLVGKIKDLNGKTRLPERTGKLDEWLRKRLPDTSLSINPSVTVDAVGTIADIRDEDGSTAAFGTGLLFELYARDGLKLKLGKPLVAARPRRRGSPVSGGLTVHDENADANVAPLNYGERARAPRRTSRICTRRDGVAALLSQGSNQYLANDGRVLNHGYRPMADLWDAVGVLNETVDPATAEPLLPLDGLTFDSPLTPATLAESVERSLERGLVAPEDLANATGLNFGSRAVTDVNRALFDSPATNEGGPAGENDGADSAVSEPAYEPSPLPRNVEYREDGTLVDRNPPDRNDIYDARGLTLIGHEDITFGERFLRTVDDEGRDLLNEVVRPGLANTFGVVVGVLDDVEQGVAEADSRTLEAVRDIAGEFADVPGSIVEGVKGAGELLRDIVLDPQTFPAQD